MFLRVCFHDNCFDGAASAALFTRFHQERIHPGALVGYRGMAHKAGEVFPAGTFDGDENAVVDFRYSADPKLTWWFDHHISAFVRPEDEAHFRADTWGHRFYDPTAPSCTGFLARTCAERFGFDVAPHRELIHWAEIIDSASFESPQVAVALALPPLQIMAWLENNHDKPLAERVIGMMAAGRPLAEIAAQPFVAGPLAGILAAHTAAIEVMRRRCHLERGVVEFDVSEDKLETYNKFIPYHFHPDCRFVVGLSLSPTRAKVSVGSNPWRPRPPVNIAAICERYGGGGHPVVGAISLPANDIERARAVTREIAEELRAAPEK